MGKSSLGVVKFVRRDRQWDEMKRLQRVLPASEWRKAAEGQSPLFVDKTRTLHNIYTTPGTRVVFARPFGFGKTTLLNQLMHLHADPLPFLGSALDHYMEAERERWNREIKSTSVKASTIRHFLHRFTPLEYRRQHPVLYFNFQHFATKSAGALHRYICDQCSAFAAIYRSTIPVQSLASDLSPFLSSIATFDTEKVAVFVDDYDAPLRNRKDAGFPDRLKVMHSFGRALHHPEVKLVFCAGETVLPELLNDPNWAAFEDASEREDLSWSCGLTLTELKSVYQHRFPVAAKALSLPEENLLKVLMEWYGNYTFSQNIATRLFDPHSIHCFFRVMKVGNYRPAMEQWESIVAIMQQYPDLLTSPSLYHPLSDPFAIANPANVNEALGTLFRLRLLTPLRRSESGSYNLQVTNNSCREILLQAANFPWKNEGVEICKKAIFAGDLVGLLTAADNLLQKVEKPQAQRLTLEKCAEMLRSKHVTVDISPNYIRIRVRHNCLFHIYYGTTQDWKIPSDPLKLDQSPQENTEKVAYITYSSDLHKLTQARVATICFNGITTSSDLQPVNFA